MKPIVGFLLLSLLTSCRHTRSIQLDPASTNPPSTDPGAALQSLVAKFPTTGPGGVDFTEGFAVTASDARKTDSLLTPLLGTIDYNHIVTKSGTTGTFPYRLELKWHDGAWKLHALKQMDRTPPEDITTAESGASQFTRLGSIADLIR